jgi:hypothetical protein
MADIDKTGSGPLLGARPGKMVSNPYVIENTVDLTGGAITAADVYQCLAIPADTLVESVHLEILTPAVGTTLTMDVGDGGATNGWMDAIDGKGVAGTFDHSTVGTDARSVAANNGYFYDAADSIDVLMEVATAITAGPKFKIYAVCYDLN